MSLLLPNELHSASISMIPGTAMNLSLVASAGDVIDLSLAIPSHQWFAGTMTNLPTDREVTLRLFRKGKDVGGYRVQTWKWVGLRPLLTYGDPDDYRCYEWYRRNAEGRWISGDPFEPRDAGNGKLPEQVVIPHDLAEQFLSNDGNYWQPWREIDDTEAFKEEQIFVMRHRFDAPTATIAIHPPFTYSYLQCIINRLRQMAPAGVSVDRLGISRGGRAQQIIRIDDPDAPLTVDANEHRTVIQPLSERTTAKRKVFLITAREHATEHTGSWAALGVLRALLADTPEAAKLRKDTTWLILPIYDPDGADNSTLQDLTDHFFDHRGHPSYGGTTPQEVLAYAHYLRAFVNAGLPIFASTSFYGLECNEGEPLCCPAAWKGDLDLVLSFNRFWFSRMSKQGMLTGSNRPWYIETYPHRMAEWCSYVYGGLTLMFEVGDRHPKQRLSLEGLQSIGLDFPDALTRFLNTKMGQERMRQTRDFLKERQVAMELWYQTKMAGTIEEPTPYDVLGVGY